MSIIRQTPVKMHPAELFSRTVSSGAAGVATPAHGRAIAQKLRDSTHPTVGLLGSRKHPLAVIGTDDPDYVIAWGVPYDPRVPILSQRQAKKATPQDLARSGATGKVLFRTGAGSTPKNPRAPIQRTYAAPFGRNRFGIADGYPNQVLVVTGSSEPDGASLRAPEGVPAGQFFTSASVYTFDENGITRVQCVGYDPDDQFLPGVRTDIRLAVEDMLLRSGPQISEITAPTPFSNAKWGQSKVDRSYERFLHAVVQGYSIAVHPGEAGISDPSLTLAVPGATAPVRANKATLQVIDSRTNPVGSEYSFNLQEALPGHENVGAKTSYQLTNPDGSVARAPEGFGRNSLPEGGAIILRFEFAVGPQIIAVSAQINSSVIAKAFESSGVVDLNDPDVVLRGWGQTPRQPVAFDAGADTTVPVRIPTGEMSQSVVTAISSEPADTLPNKVAGFDTPFFKEFWTTLVPIHLGDDESFGEIVTMLVAEGITKDTLPDYLANVQVLGHITNDREEWAKLLKTLGDTRGLEPGNPMGVLHYHLAQFIKKVAGEKIETLFPGILAAYTEFQQSKDTEDNPEAWQHLNQGEAIFAALLAYSINIENPEGGPLPSQEQAYILSELKEELEVIHSALDQPPGAPVTWIVEFITQWIEKFYNQTPPSTP